MDKEFIKIYVDEMSQEAENLEDLLFIIKENGKSEENLKVLARSLHTIKGNSAIIGLSDFASVVHSIEAVLIEVKKLNSPFPKSIIKSFFILVDVFRLIIKDMDQKGSSSVNLSALKACFTDVNYSEETRETTDLKTPAKLKKEEEVSHTQAKEKNPTNLKIKSSKFNPEVNNGIPKKAINPQISIFNDVVPPTQATINKTVVSSKNISVKLDRVDHLLNMIGELVINQNMVSEIASQAKIDIDKLQVINSQLNTIVKEVRESAFSLRMTPLDKTFKKLKRSLLDLGDILDKPVNVIVSGNESELDRGVVEKISTPLMHIVRNAMSHGIEESKIRIAAGKAKQATIKLTAMQTDDIVAITIEDDGQGLQKNQIIKKANELNLHADIASFSDQQVYNIIFESGFSTKSEEEVDDLSGRGVGMDIVKSNVEELGGEITIETKSGVGTKFTILLPLTLSIIDGLVCRDNSNHYIVPLLHVNEVIQVNPNDIGTINERGQMIHLRKEEVPLYGLEDTLCNSKRLKVLPEKEFICVVALVEGKRKAFKIDALEGVQQLVIKPLGMEFQHYNGAVGGAILGSGEAGIILDMTSLIEEISA